MIAKLHNRELAARLWGHDDQGRTWEHLYALGEVSSVHLSAAALNEAIGYEPLANIMGFTVLNDSASEAALELLDRALADGTVRPPAPVAPGRRGTGRLNLGQLTDPAAVLRAIDEHDRVGRERFLDKYGFAPARTFMLVHAGREYDSKAIAGAALAYQPGVLRSLASSDFSGGEAGAVQRLRRLGFTVRGTEAAVPARLVSAASVRLAMRQWDDVGREAFLERYSATGAARYRVVEFGRSYDARALVQAAYSIEFPTRAALQGGDFRGDRRSIAEPLRLLGFWVEAVTRDPTASAAESVEPPLGVQAQAYVDAAARVLGALNIATVGSSRREQCLLRGALGLFADESSACGLCGRDLPNALLVAAHVKKRAHCSRDEQLDLPHVGMAACKLGCDALFEDGYITVSNAGIVQVSERLSRLPALVEAAATLNGRVAVAWTVKREPYFDWHRTFHA